MTVAESDFAFVRHLVGERSAIVLDADKSYLVEARLRPVIRDAGLTTIGELVSHLRSHPFDQLTHKVVDAMTTNETSFFRDQIPFDSLREVVLPDMIKRRTTERRLRIWCAACSTGQEPFSIAMLIREHFPELLSWDCAIIATDISRAALARARAGQFSQTEVNRGLPALLLAKYFEKRGIDWHVTDPVRNMVEFREFNLAAPWSPLPPMDVVFLRNVLIYFDVRAKTMILKRVRQTMRTDGMLFLGGAESTINLDADFERVMIGRSPTYRVRENTSPCL